MISASKILLSLLFSTVCVMALSACGQTRQQPPEKATADGVIGQGNTSRPSIDLSRPGDIERATFALG